MVGAESSYDLWMGSVSSKQLVRPLSVVLGGSKPPPRWFRGGAEWQTRNHSRRTELDVWKHSSHNPTWLGTSNSAGHTHTPSSDPFVGAVTRSASVASARLNTFSASRYQTLAWRSLRLSCRSRASGAPVHRAPWALPAHSLCKPPQRTLPEGPLHARRCLQHRDSWLAHPGGRR